MMLPLKMIELISAVEIIRSGRDICRTVWGRNNSFFSAAARTWPKKSGSVILSVFYPEISM